MQSMWAHVWTNTEKMARAQSGACDVRGQVVPITSTVHILIALHTVVSSCGRFVLVSLKVAILIGRSSGNGFTRNIVLQNKTVK